MNKGGRLSNVIDKLELVLFSAPHSVQRNAFVFDHTSRGIQTSSYVEVMSQDCSTADHCKDGVTTQDLSCSTQLGFHGLRFTDVRRQS